MCSEWFELVEKAKLSNEQTEQLTVAAQAQFKVINRVHTIVWNNYIGPIYGIPERCFVVKCYDNHR